MLEVTPAASDPDERLSLELYNAVCSHDPVTIDDVRMFKAVARHQVDYIVRNDGEPAGSALGVVLPRRLDRVYAIATVLPEQRRRGAGSALYEALSAWAAGLGLRELETRVFDNDPDSLAYAERRGFVAERREVGVVLRLGGIEPPGVEPPDGVEIVTWAERPGLARGMYDAMCEAAPDIPGSEGEDLEPFEDWLAHDMQGPGDRPDATFVAVAGDEVIGYAKFSLTDAQSTVAHHDLTAVKRAWRGRGVARALKATQIAWAAANGFDEIRTSNEERNAPIRRLNARFGYRPGIGEIYLVGPLAGS